MIRDRKGRDPEYRRGVADGRLIERAGLPGGDIRFWVLDRAGRATWWTGCALRGAGLALCGLAGYLDACADAYDDGGALARRAAAGENA